MVHKGVDKRSPKVPAREKAKIQIRIADEVLEAVDDEAEARRTSRNEFLEDVIFKAVRKRL